nr:hypothetical protein [Hymenobacter volaticus]
MTNSLAYWLRQQRPLLTRTQDRRRVLAFAQTLTHGARLMPTPAEQHLLEQFVHGKLSLDQLLLALESTTPTSHAPAGTKYSYLSSLPAGLVNKNLLPLSLGGLAIGTTEFVMMGLLPYIARDYNITIPQAGYAISAYALGVVIGPRC